MYLRTRNNRVQLWLNQKELDMLNAKVTRSGLSRTAYLRQLIAGLVPRDAPPPDYYAMMRELYRIGNNLNQIAATAHTLHFIDAPRYDEALLEFRAAVRKITEAVMLPQKME